MSSFKDNEIRQFVLYPYKLYKFSIGMVPFEPITFNKNIVKTILINFYRLLAILCVVFSSISGPIALVQALGDGSSLIEATAMLTSIGFVYISTFKSVLIATKSAKINNFLDVSAAKYYNKSIENQSKYNLKNYLGLAVKLQKLEIIMGSATVWTFLIRPITQVIYNYYNGIKDYKILPYVFWYPFDTNTTWGYIAAYIHQIHIAFVSSYSFLGTYGVTIGILLLSYMNFDYISNQIKELRLNRGQDTEKVLRSILINHQETLILSEDINDIFSMAILFNYLATAYILCFVAFQATIQDPGLELLQYVFFMVFELIQLGVICYLGERLIESSSEIGNVAYNQAWYETDVKYQKTILLIMVRSQKPTIINAQGFAIVNLESYTKVTRMAYQFFTLLRNFY